MGTVKPNHPLGTPKCLTRRRGSRDGREILRCAQDDELRRLTHHDPPLVRDSGTRHSSTKTGSGTAFVESTTDGADNGGGEFPILHAALPSMSRPATTIVLTALLLPSCNDDPAPAARRSTSAAPATAPATAPAAAPRYATKSEWENAAAEDIKRHIGQFAFAVYRYEPDRWFTAVIVSVPPRDPPSKDSGSLGATVVRISEAEAARFVNRLIEGRLVRIYSVHECRLRVVPSVTYYRIGGSAGEYGVGDLILEAGPDAVKRIDAIAAALSGEGAEALRRLIHSDVTAPSAEGPDH